MKKEPFICAVLCGIMLISLAGCGNQPVPIQPETAGTSSTVIAEKSSESSQNSSVHADRMEQTEPAASGNVCAEETSFKSTGFEECSLYGAVMTHSNFSGAKFTKTELHSAKLQNCCIDGTRFEGSDTGQANMEHCS